MQVFSDRTITLELVDGARLDFPFESVEEQLTRELSPFEKVRRHAVVRVKDPCPRDLFKRFPKSDTLNYWNEEKATCAGKLAWVTQVVGDETVTLLFEDLCYMDFPFEAFTLASDVRGFMFVQPRDR